MKISAHASLFLACIALSACEEAAAPEGQAGDLTVAAYIDNDASGSLTTGDTPLANFEVALFRGSQQITTARTAADGRVIFADLEPGSYRVEAVSTPPTGATLASNPSPAAVIDFRGRAVSVDFRYVFFPGVVAGRVFRDENSNQTFEQGTDIPGPGLWVFLRVDDAGAPGAKLDSVRTDALGAYQFGLVAPGSYFLEFEKPTTIDYGTSGATRRITVVGNQSTVVDALYTGSLVISIAEARGRPNGSVVTVVGNLTAPPGAFRQSANSEIWVQDATGGIAGFSVPTTDSTRLRLGDRVEMSGTRSAFSGQVQITTNAAQVKTLGENTIVAPKTITGTELNARTDEGRLVVVTGLLVDSIGQGTGQDTVFTTAPDAQIVRIQLTAGSNANFTDTIFHVGTRYTVTGLLTQRNGVARLKPRVPSDIVPEAGTPTPVARVIINEFMANPNAVLDNVGEYIELHNWGTADANLQNWTIEDGASKDTINVSLVLPAGGYVLLALNANSTTNGGLTVDFQYERIMLNNNNATNSTIADRIVLRNPTGATIDSLSYSATTGQSQAVAGTAVGVRDPSADNADATGANWQAQTSTFGTAATPDRGTPRSQNDGYIAPTQPTPSVGRGNLVGPLNMKQR
jgi:hypothetical protein